jgi:hypothetical protein
MTVVEVIALLQKQVELGNGDLQLEMAPVTTADRYEITDVMEHMVTGRDGNPQKILLL